MSQQIDEDLTYIEYFPVTNRILYGLAQPFRGWQIVPTLEANGRYRYLAFTPEGEPDPYRDWSYPDCKSAEVAIELGKTWIAYKMAKIVAQG